MNTLQPSGPPIPAFWRLGAALGLVLAIILFFVARSGAYWLAALPPAAGIALAIYFAPPERRASYNSRAAKRATDTRSRLEFFAVGVLASIGVGGAVIPALAGLNSLVIDWPLFAAPLILLYFLIVAAFVAPPVRRAIDFGTTAFVAAMIGLYVYGIAIEANVHLDHSSPVAYRSTILKRTARTGKATGDTIVVAPWGTFKTPQEYVSGFPELGNASVGADVLVVVHNGALGARWITIRRAEPQSN